MRSLLATLAFAFAALSASGAKALIFEDFARSVTLEFLDESGNSINAASDSEGLPPGGIFQNPLNAFFGGAGYQASIGMNVAGFFVLTGEQFRTGTMTASVSITVLVTNDLTNPVDVPFNFIINGGRFAFFAGQGSSLTYELLVNTFSFVSTGTLSVDPTTFQTAFTATGEDIGATFDGSQVTIPFSFNGVTETLQPGSSMFFSYDLLITSDVIQFAEFSFFEFQNPALFGNLPPGACRRLRHHT